MQNIELWDIASASGPCVCSQLRRTTRRVTQIYDQALASTGLTVSQHALLVNVARAGSVSRTALAAKLGMDRTTLTRNLRPLEAANLVTAAKSEDGRERGLRVSPEGKRKLRQSYQLWEEAQKNFIAQLGPKALTQLRSALEATESAAHKS